jgi:NADH:ubiquinone oxidoreductase subunit
MLNVTIYLIQDFNQRRWVEYNDYLSVRSPNGDRIPPKWHGWIHQMYDDDPLPDSDSFHDPFFEKPHQWESSTSAFRMYVSKTAPIHPKFLEYTKSRQNKFAAEWTPVTKRA